MTKFLILVGAALMSATSLADAPVARLAGDQVFETNLSSMLYFRMPFGAGRRDAFVPAFGFRLDRASHLDQLTWDGTLPRYERTRFDSPMFDWNLSTAGKFRLSMNGALMYASPDDEEDGSLDSSDGPFDIESLRGHPVRTTLIGVGVVAVILCATRTGICEHNRRDTSTETPETPGGGT